MNVICITPLLGLQQTIFIAEDFRMCNFKHYPGLQLSIQAHSILIKMLHHCFYKKIYIYFLVIIETNE